MGKEKEEKNIREAMPGKDKACDPDFKNTGGKCLLLLFRYILHLISKLFVVFNKTVRVIFMWWYNF